MSSGFYVFLFSIFLVHYGDIKLLFHRIFELREDKDVANSSKEIK